MKQIPPPPNNCNGCIASACQPKKCDYCEACQDLIFMNIEPTAIVYIIVALIVLITAYKLNK